MKREDSSLIDTVAKRYKYVEKWKSIPLIYVSRKYLHDNKILLEDSDDLDFRKGVISGVEYAPIDEFIFTRQIYVDDPKTIFKIKIDKENSKVFMTGSAFNTSKDAILVKAVVTLEGDTITSKVINSKNLIHEMSTIEEANKLLSDLNDFIMNNYFLIFFTLYTLHKTDLYPIEKTVNNFKRKFKHGSKKKIGKQRTIVYLNKLPVKYIGGKKLGGHHASPRYHQRIGHMHTMRHERFKDHPDYMKPIWRKPVWVGVKETIVDGVTYKVL